MKKILVNAYMAKNLGDDLFVKILLERYPNVEFIFTDYVIKNGAEEYRNVFINYKNVSFKYKYLNKYNILRRFLKNKVIKKQKFEKYDACIYIGGSIFMQIPQWKSQLEERLKCLSTLKKHQKPYFVLGANFGPYYEEVFRSVYLDFFKECKDVCFRDQYSKSLFLDLDNVRVHPDIVFQLKHKSKEKIENTLGIVPINLKSIRGLEKYKAIYEEKIKDIICYAKGLDIKVTLFSFCKHLGDLDTIQSIYNNLSEEEQCYVTIVDYDGDIDCFLDKFSEMESIVATRFHACILSQVFNQGVYPLIYSDKTYYSLLDLELAEYYTYIKEIENLNIKDLFTNIKKNKIYNKSLLKSSERQFEKLDQFLL
ncbi:MAG: polysaccharide pyruvyl transferase family protein [Turicibacter sp.]|nr:polysaccharide pyruvyl transferase family protein [Turicibacter sp.]